MLTNDKEVSTIVLNSTLDIEGSNGEGTGKAYYNRISRICYGASVHDLQQMMQRHRNSRKRWMPSRRLMDTKDLLMNS